uniref:Skin secretory protein xP2-like n=1 Tax=Pelodiscus sinensis TaxID=13735 RepID=K7G8W0_PELSI|nr:skin secretory protein xP2-like [Pelodiscus sinensis]|eukprot:XP_014433510.1 skin secretory protein xP2-like [Pelodiscus sinensis]
MAKPKQMAPPGGQTSAVPPQQRNKTASAKKEPVRAAPMPRAQLSGSTPALNKTAKAKLPLEPKAKSHPVPAAPKASEKPRPTGLKIPPKAGSSHPSTPQRAATCAPKGLPTGSPGKKLPKKEAGYNNLEPVPVPRKKLLSPEEREAKAAASEVLAAPSDALPGTESAAPEGGMEPMDGQGLMPETGPVLPPLGPADGDAPESSRLQVPGAAPMPARDMEEAIGGGESLEGGRPSGPELVVPQPLSQQGAALAAPPGEQQPGPSPPQTLGCSPGETPHPAHTELPDAPSTPQGEQSREDAPLGLPCTSTAGFLLPRWGLPDAAAQRGGCSGWHLGTAFAIRVTAPPGRASARGGRDGPRCRDVG